MNKKDAIKLINRNLRLSLDNTNTNWSNINANELWSIEPRFERKNQLLFLVLNNNKTRMIHVFKIPQLHSVYPNLYIRGDKGVYRLIFDISDSMFVEKLKHIDFKSFHISSIKY